MGEKVLTSSRVRTGEPNSNRDIRVPPAVQLIANHVPRPATSITAWAAVPRHEVRERAMKREPVAKLRRARDTKFNTARGASAAKTFTTTLGTRETKRDRRNDLLETIAVATHARRRVRAARGLPGAEGPASRWNRATRGAFALSRAPRRSARCE